MEAEIIAIGSELLTPHRQDTNSLFLTERLNQLGVEVTHKSVVGDDRAHLTEAVRLALRRADVVICMGGLGPTEDDLTRECVAEALGLELRRDPDIVAELYARFAARRIKMPENNVRQADVLHPGGVALKNPRGTAPGQWVEAEVEGAGRSVVLLPGPPDELKPMWDNEVMERLRAKAPRQFIATRMLRICMMPESECDAIAAPIYKKHGSVQTTILAGAGEVQLHLRCRADSQEQAEECVLALSSELEDALEERIFSTGGESLEQIVLYLAEMRQATIAVAESCTGGVLAQRLTSLSGSSRVFLGGAIVYSNDLKTMFADVPPLLIAEHGAVSAEVASAMAEGIRKRCKTTLGVGITGVAGPTGGTAEKPVGLVFHAVSDGKKTDVVRRNFPGDRDRIRWWATQQALEMLRKRLA